MDSQSARGHGNDQNVDAGKTAAALSVTWRMCQACGHWQRATEDDECSVCQWPRLALGATCRDLAKLHVLVDTELSSGGQWDVPRIISPRVGSAINQDIILQRLKDNGLPILLGESARKGVQFPSGQSWDLFRGFAESLLTDELNALFRRSWEGLLQPSSAHVYVSIRLMLLDSDVSFSKGKGAPSWLVVVPFDKAVVKEAARLRDGDVSIDTSRTQLGFGPDGDRLKVDVQATREVLINECLVASGKKRILVAPINKIVRRETLTALPVVVLSADAMRGFTANGVCSGVITVSVRGTEKKFSTSLPITQLPDFSDVADLFLDLGSTNTKWALRLEGKEPKEYDQETEALTRDWGISSYSKAYFLSDPSGERWSDWVTRALPALRHWVGREHNAFLRTVHFSLPCTKQFDVNALAKTLQTKAPSGNDTSPSALQLMCKARKRNLVSHGAVVLVPEHELVAHHYLGTIRILQEAAQAYAARFNTHDARRNDQSQRQQLWDSRQEEVRIYEQRTISRLWHTRPSGPSGSRPNVDKRITNPAQWMNDLIEHPKQFEHVVLLDAGGLSLDISVLEKNGLVRDLSHSDMTCGGEAISSSIGRKLPGEKGTKYKAQLGIRWRDAQDEDNDDQRQYRDVTRELHRPVLTKLFEALGARWKRTPHCCVLLTGGGSRNPHLAEYVGKLAKNVNLNANVMEASDVQDLIHLAREFTEPLHELSSDEIRRFEATQVWSKRRERNPLARYDKFAVVGGMFALGGAKL